MTAHELMVERLVRAGIQRGREELANLAYGMARTCLKIAEGGAPGSFRTFDELRGVGELRTDLTRMTARVGALPHDLSTLPLADPSPDAAVMAADACLDLTRSIEGGTPRTEYARAMLDRAAGRPDEAVGRLGHMLTSPLSRRWWMFVNEGIQGTLFLTGDFETIIAIGQRVMPHDPRDSTSIYNVLAAYAWLGMRQEFLDLAPKFTASLIGVADPSFWSQQIRKEAEAFAGPLCLEIQDVYGLIPATGTDGGT